MLSRVADSLYWMTRYLERAENISRYIEVNWHMTLEQPDRECMEWGALISTTGDANLYQERFEIYNRKNVLHFLLFDASYAHSVISCLRAARENARTIREFLAVEIWELVNGYYHMVETAGKNRDYIYENPSDFCQRAKLRGMTLCGALNETILHGEGWHFSRLGRYLERADKTTRILDVKYFILRPESDYTSASYDYVRWAGLLRASGGLDAYRQKYGRVIPNSVVEFMFFEPNFARSVFHSLREGQRSLHAITGTPIGEFQNRAERLLGRLYADLAYDTINDVFDTGVHEYTDRLQKGMNEIHEAVWESFFQ